MDKSIEVVGASQDLTVIDVTDSDSRLSVGDDVRFIMNYKSLAMAMICPYLEKQYVIWKDMSKKAADLSYKPRK